MGLPEGSPISSVGCYAVFLRAFAAGFGSILFCDLAFSFAANSCFTLKAIASVSTLYVWAAARRTFPPSDCVLAESRMTVSTISFPSALSSALGL